MSILEEIKQAAVDTNSDLGTLLRKCKVLAAHLRSPPLENWLIWESTGYPADVEVPKYRTWRLEVKGHFTGPFGAEIRNASIPLAYIPEGVRNRYEKYEYRESIASIEEFLKKPDTGTATISTGDLALILGTTVFKDQNCLHAWAEFSQAALVELVNAVRNRILDFALAMWKEDPTAGESVSSAGKILESSKVSQIFNTTVFGGSANLVGIANVSSIVFNITTGDLSSLEKALSENGISEEDIEKLRVAVESEEKQAQKDGFGPKVSLWIGKMMQKAAEGTWGAGVGAGGALLAQALGKYYGF